MQIRDRVKELRRVRAGDLRPSPRNWRTHPKAQRDALQGILAEVGYADALLARELDSGGLELIDGHLRAETTPDQEVPVLILDVTEEEAGKLLATLDPLAAMATADGEKLDSLLQTLSTSSESLADLYARLAKESGAAAEMATIEDEAPAPLPVAVTRPGDLWILGTKPAHRLLCGDSTKPADVTRVMAGHKAALVATDPPYLVDYTGERPKKGNRNSGKDWSGVYREIDITDAERFFTGLFGNVVSVMAPKAAIYCWHAHRRCGLIQSIWERLGILDHQQIIWVKPTSVFGRVYWHFRHEPCMMGWVKGSQPEHDNDHAHDSVWTIGWESPTGEMSRPSNNEHPTQKPVEIFARPMRKHTRKHDICFEPFSGSGSQLIAAQQLSRTCHAIELEPVFVDVAIRRWQKLTGLAAVLEGTEKTWREVAAERKVGVPMEGPTAGTVEAKKAPKPKGKKVPVDSGADNPRDN